METFTILEHAARRAAVVRKTVAWAEVPAAQRAARAALTRLLAGDAPAAGTSLTVWRKAGDKVDYAPGVLIDDDRAVQAPAELLELPAGRVAHATLYGGYEELPDAWSRLFAECSRRGLEPAGLNWEIYDSAGDADQAGGPTTRLFALLS